MTTRSMMVKIPRKNLEMTGQMWMDDILKGHDGVFYEQMGMSKLLFCHLGTYLEDKGALQNTRWISTVEQLGVLLFFLKSGNSNALLNHRFQRSPATISK